MSTHNIFFVEKYKNIALNNSLIYSYATGTHIYDLFTISKNKRLYLGP